MRFTHWANAIAVTVLAMSGMQIFMAFPSFGPKIPQENIVDSIPRAIALGGWLGGALQWHFTFMWFFAGAGLLYVVSQVDLRTLPDGAVHAARRAGRVADGAPLLPVRTEAASDGSIQSAAEARVHEHADLRHVVAADRARDVQAGAVLHARPAVRRLPHGAADSLHRDVRHLRVHPRASGDGGAPRMGQLRVDGDRLEAAARLHATSPRVR